MRIARTARELTQCKNLVMAGGVALNSVANGLIYKSGLFEMFGFSLRQVMPVGFGAALAAFNIYFEKERIIQNSPIPNFSFPIPQKT